MKKFTRYIVLSLVCALPMVLLAQTTVSMPVNVAGAVYTVTKPTGVTLGIITVTSPVGAAYTYSLDGGTYQSSPVFSGLADNSTHTISVKTTANGTLSTSPPIQVVACDNDISTGTGTIAKMLYDNTGSGTATYNWCAREVTGPDGNTWLDRNLGAYEVATSNTDAQGYGSLYQWGRDKDGHQLAGTGRGVDVATSPNSSTLATSDVPGNGNFILSAFGGTADWRSDNNNNRWNLTSGSGATFTQANNPCPSGYHVPTNGQWATLESGLTGSAMLLPTTLKLSLPGYRYYPNGVVMSVGVLGYYWASTPSGFQANCLIITSSGGGAGNQTGRGGGFAVRCIKN